MFHCRYTFARHVCFHVDGEDFHAELFNITFTHPLDDPIMDTAMTLHSIKNISYVYRMHCFHAIKAYNAANRRMLLLNDEQMINFADIPLQSDSDLLRVRAPNAEVRPQIIIEVIFRDFIDRQVHIPRLIRGFETRKKVALDSVVLHNHKSACQFISFSFICSSYSHLIGVSYVLKKIEPLVRVDFIYTIGIELIRERFIEPKSSVWAW